MTFSWEVINTKGKSTPSIADITTALNDRFQDLKAKLPYGYMDAFESRLSLICTEIAHELGGELYDAPDGTLVFDFSGQYQFTSLYRSRETFAKTPA